jgi:TRAP-type C4-dicarboxylate transport system permease small subunit
MSSFRRAVHALSRCLNWVSMGAVVAMMLLVCVNAIARPLGRPLLGTFEMVEFLTGIVVAFALPFTTAIHRHISVDLLTHRLSKQRQVKVDKIVFTISLGIFGLLTWQLFVYAADLSRTGTVSATLRLPVAPIVYATGLCCGVVCLVLIANLFMSSAGSEGK